MSQIKTLSVIVPLLIILPTLVIGATLVSKSNLNASSKSIQGLVDVRRSVDNDNASRWNWWLSQASDQDELSFRMWLKNRVQKAECGFRQRDFTPADPVTSRSKTIRTKQQQQDFEKWYRESYRAYLIANEVGCLSMTLKEIKSGGSDNVVALKIVEDLLQSPLSTLDFNSVPWMFAIREPNGRPR